MMIDKAAETRRGRDTIGDMIHIPSTAQDAGKIHDAVQRMQ